MTHLFHPARDDMRISRVLAALADPVRLHLVAQVADGSERSCAAEEWGVQVHKSTLSHHFRVLREAGVTMTRVDGRNRWIRLRRADLDARFPGLLAAVLAALPEEAAHPQDRAAAS
ncbi:ArsR/SmtB family transcription factor [Marinitenerispora sediminis]|uniref:Transcriptional regulator n=1 Tax=Marinitenerispora sediminis TaxID=1931232 RepID=A0A368TC29_9ACTN|nr:helix-turn-helix domain-containing protein [Marinitenerispora sediminis]RCV55294.1 transcriptional regulator [Marinitenerispora sediminis]RCV61621.1 transcriptional regulator [Marinitenerispora sediminis]RCV62668.1 transcriptional regulator [Marinitenerispora sediminis]